MSEQANEQISETTKILVYDLPSENINNLDSEIKNKIRNVRVTSTKLLHSLGVQCTESVILIAPSRISRIETTIAKVNQLYSSLPIALTPNIVVLPLTQQQQESLSQLAKSRIQERVEESINRISLLLDNLAQITETRIRTRIRSNVNELKRQFITLKQICDELRISVRDMDYLIKLIDEALSKI